MAKLALAITGCALLTPLDEVANETGGTWRAIRAGKKIETKTAVDDHLIDPDPHLDRSIRLALSVARQAIGDETIGPETALFCGTSKGPVGTFLDAADRLRHNETISETAARQITLGPAAMGTILRERLAIHGPAHTSVAACASGLVALHRAAQALWQTEADLREGRDTGGPRRALIVAADASLHPLFAASFQRLGVLAPADAQGIRHCHPFSNEGHGFFLSEAAAAIMIELQDSAIARPDPPYAWIEESWIGADSTSLISTDPSADSLRRGIAATAGSRGGRDEGLAFVHAHATGTQHDAYELAAIRSIIPAHIPVFSSKAYLGHSLGAAGLVSLALSIQCHLGGTTLDGHWVEPDTTSLTLAQGFGGHIALVRIRG